MGSVRSAVKIVHTSDVHLDSRGTEPDADGYRNRSERAFAAVLDTAVAEDAHLLLIVGDLFDNNRVDQSNIDFVYRQLARLRAHQQAVVLPGNHDVHDERSVWDRFSFDAAGENVSGLLEHAGDCLTFEDLGVRVWGRAMREHAPENYPLDGAPAGGGDYWNVGMAHGQVVDQRIAQGSSPITRAEIRASGFHYLALGHIHVFEDHSVGGTAAYYCGSPVAHHAGANGGRVALVTLCPSEGVRVRSRVVSAWNPEAAGGDHRSNGFPW